MKQLPLLLLGLLALAPLHAQGPAGAVKPEELFALDNLQAWCVVPFDAKKRGPVERAEMLHRLGFKRFVYDWRAKDIPAFDAEFEAMKKHGIEITAWWSPTDPRDPVLLKTLEVFQRQKVHPQLWVMGRGAPANTPEEQQQRVEHEAGHIREIAEVARPYGCKVGLYNHGGWFGQTDNQVAVIERLRQLGVADVGIVYNFSHGHGDIADFPAIWKRMQPYVVAVNVTGMVEDGESKIMPPSQGEFELGMLRVILDSGWRGPIGLIAEQGGDAEVTLGNYLRGLEWCKKELAQPGSGGPRPDFSARPKNGAAKLPEREPLDPVAHPFSTHPVNRDRIYDFYAKQARDYAASAEKPALLPAFPGLDSGLIGHWGNQTEAGWKTGLWNEMDLGSLHAGVLRHAGLTVPRGVCVRLDPLSTLNCPHLATDFSQSLESQLSTCFDPDTLTWPVAWRGGFVRFGDARFGFLGGIEPAGEAIAAPKGEPAKAGSFTYRGFFRHGAQVIFSYARDGVEWLETASSQGGSVVIAREIAATGKLAALTHGGPAQWPQIFETSGTPGTGKPYAIDTLTLPAPTPWRSLWHIGGLDFLPNGDAAICTMEGEVWLVAGIDDTLAHLRWKRFATGLHQPLGLNVVDGKICVLGRDQITRLHDLNGDGEADFYECLANTYLTPVGGHDFVTGLQHDREGRFYIASGKQGVVRVTPGAAEVLATGLRNPNGLGLGPNGEVSVAVQEGEWTPASMLYEFVPKPGEPPGHHGHGGPRPGPRGHVQPLAYLPRGVDNSCGGQCYVQGDRWGVPAGTLVHFSWGNGTAFLVLREQLGDVRQGCVVPLPGDFASGAHRGAFSPRDGQLYVAGMGGWGTYTPAEGSLQRMRYTGGAVQVPRATEAHENGVLLRFSEPLNQTASDVRRYFAQEWSYRYSAAYGSEEYSVRSPDKRGHDPLAITSAHVLDEGRALFLEIPQLAPANVLHLHCDLPGMLARDFYLTLHRLGPAFTQFPGYQAIAKTDPHAGHHLTTSDTAPKPVKWEQGPPGRALHIQTSGGLQFAQKELRAKAGERLSLSFENPDAMPHNWVLVKLGAIERVGDLATKLITAPDALARHYVPDSPDVLAHTRILDPQKTTTIHFTAPAQPGRYPYVCTFPGHWMLMRGELVVE